MQFVVAADGVVRAGVVGIGHQLVDRQLAIGAAGLGRAVVGLHGFLDDPQLFGGHLHVLAELID